MYSLISSKQWWT